MSEQALPSTSGTRAIRAFAWIMVAATFAYLINNWLMFWHDWPGPGAVFAGNVSGQGIIHLALYAVAVALPVLYVMRADTPLRQDSERLSAITNFIVRAAFWGVLLVGVVDAAISFLRVEGLLAGVIGKELSDLMNFNSNRAPMVHGPLILIGIVIAAVSRKTIGFHWLALLVVIAELNIVLSRFIFSYEQAFMGDLVYRASRYMWMSVTGSSESVKG